MTVRPALLVPLAVAAALAAGLPVLAAPPAVAAAPGYVRLAHLSPDTPEVDVYVTSFRGGRFSKVLPGVSYGTLSDYQRLTPGRYAVAMRRPGAPADSAPLLRTTLRVTRGDAYTVAGVGRNANLELLVLDDDLSRPSAGKARMRVVQASSVAPVVNVSTSTGVPIADGARFPSTTRYAEVAAQQWTLRAVPGGDVASADATVQVKAGAIYTALVLDEGTSAIQLVVRSDAASSATQPRGSVATGLGGGSRTGGGGASPGLPYGLILGIAALLGLGVHAGRPVLARARR